MLILCKIERIVYEEKEMSLVVLDENKWQKILAFLQTEDRVNIQSIYQLKDTKGRDDPKGLARLTYSKWGSTVSHNHSKDCI